MAKRSPILGYNHNVRYRGLVFHVQTEDSGILSPHMFTHLFHTGVIVSTRKLVYDAGSAEESIKSLMQAQHKAVLKDLKRGHFDDKIDEYLGGTPGLLPRGTIEAHGEPAPDLGRPNEELPATEPMLKLDPLQLVEDHGSRPNRHDPTIPDVRPGLERAPTPEPGAVANAISAAANATLRTAPPTFVPDSTPVPRDFADSAPEIEIQLELDEPDEADAISARTRTPRDADARGLDEHTRPTIDVSQLSDGIPPPPRQPGESIPPLPPPPDPRRTPSAGVGAATLPPARPISRPASKPAILPPTVVSRPISTTDSDGRNRNNSDAIEVYAPPPPSAETPPGMRADEANRPGQYSQHKRVKTNASDPSPPPVRSPSSVPIPPGLGRPGRSPSSQPNATNRPTPGGTPVPRDLRAAIETQPIRPTPGSRDSRVDPPARPTPGGTPVPRDLRSEHTPRPTPGGTSVPRDLRPDQTPRPTPSSTSVPRDLRAEQTPRPTPSNTSVPRDLRPDRSTPPTGQPARPRTLTPPRSSPPTAARTGSPSSGGGVVMTRPAVIVGAPAKTPTQPRIRKAREDEGRGFGQGLISEKSLDEVILAYLSEDADEK